VSAYFYGATHERDAYLLALAVPTYFSAVMSGVLSMVFIPIFIDYHKKNPQQAWRIASTLINLIGLLSVFITIACFLFSRQVVGFLAPNYNAYQTKMTIDLLHILIPVVMFSTINIFFSSLYYAEFRFIRAALVPIVSAVIMVTCNVAFNSLIGIKSLAFGSLAGSAVGMLILLPGMLGKGRYTFCLDIREEGLRRLFWAALPLFIVSLLYNFNTPFQRMIAANLSTGSISFMAYATQIVVILTSLTSSGITTTVFPMISHSWAEKDIAATGRHLAMGIRLVLLISMPITAGALIFGSTFVSLLFERGAFDHKATLAVTQCLVLLMGSFVAGGLNNILSKVFYTANKTLFFAIYNVFETLAYMGLAWMLSRWFSFRGLAMAASIRDIIGLMACLFVVSQTVKGIAWLDTLKDIFKIAASTLILLLMFIILNYWFAARMPGVALLALAVCLSVALYSTLTIYVFRIEDARHLLRKVAVKIPFLNFLQYE
jgi:putative peptidoglycan lipid II flippase